MSTNTRDGHRFKIGTEMDSYTADEAVRLGILAEKIGLDSVWVNDHLIDGPSIDPWSTIGAIAANTSKLFFCSTVTDTQRVHPAKTAQIISTLDRISKGRVALGIGAGEAMNIVPFGLPWESPIGRRTRLAEAVQVVKLLWGSSRTNPVSFSGKYYTLTNAWLDQPLAKPPPLYIGSLGARKTLEMVGRLGDGWDSFLNTPDSFRTRMEIVKSSARQAGRDPETIEPIAEIVTSLAEDGEGLRAATDKMKHVLVLEGMILKERGIQLPKELERTYQNLLMTDQQVQVLTESAHTVPDDIALEVMAHGSPAEIAETIEKFRSAGVRHLLIQFLEPGEQSLRKFCEKVLPRIDRDN